MSAVRRVAAIDIGTVTTRLLVADVSAGGITEVHRSTDITHLGERLTATGRLSDAAMGRVVAVVARYAADIERLGAEAVRAIATSAARDAANGAEFEALLAARGIVPEVVAGELEARLAFSGATYAISGEGLLVNDIGGGSTELVLGRRVAEGSAAGSEVLAADSIDVGSRRVTDRFLRSDPPADDEIAAAREWVRGELAPYFSALPTPPRVSIALAGTATTLSAIRQDLAVYDPTRVHGSTLTRDEITSIFERLAPLPLERRAAEVAGLDPGRAPVIVAGSLILMSVLEGAGLDSTLVSEHDILYGILLDAYARLENSGG